MKLADLLIMAVETSEEENLANGEARFTEEEVTVLALAAATLGGSPRTARAWAEILSAEFLEEVDTGQPMP